MAPLTSSQCPSGVVQFGSADVSLSSVYTYYCCEVNLNVVQATSNLLISQVQLPLADNSASTTPMYIRFGVFLASGNASDTSGATSLTLSLLAQSDEITIYPTTPFMLYAQLQQRVQIIAGATYAIGFYSTSPLQVYQAPSSGWGGWGPWSNYNSYAMPQLLTGYSGGFALISMAGSGCAVSTSDTAFYSICGYLQQYQAAGNTNDFTSVAATTTIVVQGVLAASLTPTHTTSGMGYAVTAIYGDTITTVSGQDYSYYPSSSSSGWAVTKASTYRIQGASPNDLIYPSSNTNKPVVDASGLTLQLSNGVQYVLQYNTTTGQYQILNSSLTGLSTATTVFSNFTAVPMVTGAADPVCAPPPSIYLAPTLPSCPSGYERREDFATDFSRQDDGYYFIYDYSNLQGNVLYFDPFAIQVPGTIIDSLASPLMANPLTVIHMRLGLFVLNGSLAAPSWTLLTQTAEIVVANTLGGTFTGLLTPSYTVMTVGTYAVGVWFDQPVFAYGASWISAPGAFNLYQLYSTSALPLYVVPQADYDQAIAFARGCVPKEVSLAYFSYCAAFPVITADQHTNNTTVSGTFIVLNQPINDAYGSYYMVVGGNGSYSEDAGDTLLLGSINNPSPMKLYTSGYATSGLPFDISGISMFGLNYDDCGIQLILNSRPVPYTPTYSVNFALQYPCGNPTPTQVGPGQFSLVAGSSVPSCAYNGLVRLNQVVPASVPVDTCGSPGQMPVILGDPVIADYSKQTEGNSIPANTVYTNSFTPSSATTVTQLAVDLLANTAVIVNVQLGLYSSSGALLGSTAPFLLQQIYDQQVVQPLISAVVLTAGSEYFLAILADQQLNIAQSASSSGTVTAQFSAGLPSNMSMSESTGGAVAVAAYGCATATHSLCGFVQYYVPEGVSMYGPATMLFQYEGLIVGSTASNGSVVVTTADIHLLAFNRPATSYPSQTLIAFSQLSLSAPAILYPGQMQCLGGSGLRLYSNTLATFVNVSWSTSFGRYAETYGAAFSLYGSVINSVFNVTSVGSSGRIVQSCNLIDLPSSITPATPSAPTCPAGESSLQLGDDYNGDFYYNLEEFGYYTGNWLTTQQVRSTNSAYQIQQIAFEINVNVQSRLRFTFAVYDANMDLAGITNEVTVTNNVADLLVIATLQIPVTMPPNSTYYLALAQDNTLWASFSQAYLNPCGPVIYSNSSHMWPANLIPVEYSTWVCAAPPLAALGCTVATPTSRVSSSSSDNANLSKGAVAGIVIGCVLGTNALLLLCLFLACGIGGWNRKGDKAVARQRGGEEDVEGSEVQAPSHVEMINQEEPLQTGQV